MLQTFANVRVEHVLKIGNFCVCFAVSVPYLQVIWLGRLKCLITSALCVVFIPGWLRLVDSRLYISVCVCVVCIVCRCNYPAGEHIRHNDNTRETCSAGVGCQTCATH